jgi:outer membrane protein OmpA-like peptidoglycan-associated protein
MSRFSRSLARWSVIASLAILAACTSHNPPPVQPGVYHVDFDTDSSSIDGVGQRTIYAVADAVKANSASSVTIVGRADAAGTPAYNAQLAKKRALAVHDALVATGQVAPDRIETSWTSEKLDAGVTAGATPPPGSRVVDIFVH